jgi:hypothetical protein
MTDADDVFALQRRWPSRATLRVAVRDLRQHHGTVPSRFRYSMYDQIRLARRKSRERPAMRSKLIGTIIGIVFGVLWGVVGANPLPPKRRITALVAIVHIAAVLIVAAARTSGSAHVVKSKQFNGRIYGIAVAAEALAIVSTVPLLTMAPYRRSRSSSVFTFWASGKPTVSMFVWICVGHNRTHHP